MNKSVRDSLTVIVFGLIGFSGVLFSAIWLHERQGEQPHFAKDAAEIPGLKTGDSVSISVLNDPNDRLVRLFDKDYSVLCFVAKTCAKCFDESAVWQRLAAEPGLQTFVVLADSDRATVRKVVAAYGLSNMAVLYDPAGKVRKHFDLHLMPQYLVFNRRGKVIHRELGYVDAVGLTPEERVQAILASTHQQARTGSSPERAR